VRAFSTAYVATTPTPPAPSSGADQGGARFFAVRDLESPKGPRLAFDHSVIVADAIERLRGELERDGGLAVSFLDEPFTIPALRRVYEAVWGGPVHRGDFGRKVLLVGGSWSLLAARRQYGRPPRPPLPARPNARFRPSMQVASMLLTKPVAERPGPR
jgi:8-oxo-dGTP diphosphatase